MLVQVREEKNPLLKRVDMGRDMCGTQFLKHTHKTHETHAFIRVSIRFFITFINKTYMILIDTCVFWVCMWFCFYFC